MTVYSNLVVSSKFVHKTRHQKKLSNDLFIASNPPIFSLFLFTNSDEFRQTVGQSDEHS